ncbi:MAG: DAK2 domain-containing protein [Chloroflexi bacterium]|nr:DAK2 domain-containing protein [Chloroflexota bacterium]
MERHVGALNAINVFPVPDGDTGTNMHLTLRAAIDALEQSDADDVSGVTAALARGALMGARGNSGVILSQVLLGLSRGLEGKAEASGSDLASALAEASDAAYAALAEPREGTILTVVRAAAEATADATTDDPAQLLSLAVDAAHEAVARTPELLPVLKEAGVVDAGGLGLAIILDGLSRSLHGDTLDVDLAPDVPDAAGWQSQAATLHQAEHGTPGYCTEFVVSGQDIDPKAARAQIAALGGSLLVVGDETLLRVHVHTATPDDVLDYGRTLGEVSQVKVDNMEAQMQTFAGEPAPSNVTNVGVVAVASGAGIEAAFRSVGVTKLVQGGQTLNPSAGELLTAIEACPQDQVVVLPNNGNIIAAAEQAAAQADKSAVVIPSRSIPQGIAAVLALSPDLSFEENSAAMARAIGQVRSAEVTRAVRATTMDGQKIDAGQAIGIVDGKLSVVSHSIEEAVLESVLKMGPETASLLTVYSGSDVRAGGDYALANRLREQHPDLEIELVRGGQPHYAYLLSLE